MFCQSQSVTNKIKLLLQNSCHSDTQASYFDEPLSKIPGHPTMSLPLCICTTGRTFWWLSTSLRFYQDSLLEHRTKPGVQLEAEAITKGRNPPPSSCQLSTPSSPEGSEGKLQSRSLPLGDSMGQAGPPTHERGQVNS